MFRISLVRIFLQKYHHQASDGVGVYFHVCECAEGRVHHEGRGNVKLQKRKWGMVLLHLSVENRGQKNVFFFFFFET